MQDIILATNNAGKVLELQTLLAPFHAVPQSTLHLSSAEETGMTFIENAILKARHVSRLANRPALADDSGLVVHALGGRPGIYSARFAGKQATDAENIERLLAELRDVPSEQRQAQFYCAIVLLQHADDPSPILATGYCEGQITLEPKGEKGFGYDPVFYVPEYHCTFAELGLEIKNTISHRAKALQALKKQMQQLC